MKLFKNILFITILFCFISTNNFAQRSILSEEEQVKEAIKTETNEILKEVKRFSNFLGTITVDIGVISNWEVSTLFNINKPMFTYFFLIFY
jgi:hypothetical protein